MVVSEMKKEADTMRVILKILAAPIIVVLTLFVWICSGLLYCSSFILGLAGTVLGILGVLVLLTGADVYKRQAENRGNIHGQQGNRSHAFCEKE